MKIEYVHSSRFGNGTLVAQEFVRQMVAHGVAVNVNHVKEVSPGELPPADLYVFSSPGRMGKPISGAKRFLQNLALPAGTKYAVLTTEAAPRPDRKTGKIPTEMELAKYQRVRPIINEILDNKGLLRIAEDAVYVTGLKGPLELGWEGKVALFASNLLAAAVTGVELTARETPVEEAK
jgi:hypothetical protein